MEYKNILNKDLRIAGIHIAELPKEYKNNFLKQWGGDVPIDALTIYYDRQHDYLVVNMDEPIHDKFINLAEVYLQLDDQKRCEFSDIIISKSVIDACEVLDNCIFLRALRGQQDTDTMQ